MNLLRGSLAVLYLYVGGFSAYLHVHQYQHEHGNHFVLSAHPVKSLLGEPDRHHNEDHDHAPVNHPSIDTDYVLTKYSIKKMQLDIGIDPLCKAAPFSLGKTSILAAESFSPPVHATLFLTLPSRAPPA